MFFHLISFAEDKPDMEELMSTYASELMRLCYLYLKDYQLAEDAVQDTFLRAYTKYNSFRRQSSERTWIISIAINTCKNYLRKKSFKEIKESENLFSLADDEIDSESALINTEDNINLLNAVCNLAPIYKEVILLYYYQEFKINQIAETLKEKETTIAVRLKRARDILKDYYMEEI